MTTLTKDRIAQRKRRVMILTAVLLVLLFLWRPVRQLAAQATLAALLTALCLPLARLMEKRMGRTAASLFSVAGALMIVIGLIGLVLPEVIGRISQLIGQLPGLFSMLENTWQEISRMEIFTALQLDTNLPRIWMQELGTYIAAEAPKLISALGAGVDVLSKAFLAPVLAYYFLRDREIFAYRISMWIPSARRKTVMKMLQQMKMEAGSYLRGQILIGLCVMGMTSLGLMVLGIPSFLTLGIIMGVCEFIPYIGPLIGGIPIVLFSLPLGLTKALWALGMVIVVQQIEGCILSPRLMAGAVSLHPVYVILLLSAGGLVGGLWGMMAAIPLFVCARGAMHVLYVEKQPEKVVKIFGNDKE